MLKVELIYDRDCPNVAEAREQLRLALAEVGLPPQWQEWDRASLESPAYVRAYGSPSILVNSQDVADVSPSSNANCCRIYSDQTGRLKGVPSSTAIALAMRQAKRDKGATESTLIREKDWRSVLTVLPASGMALLPSLTCPACWPAYTALLSTLGLSFVNYTPYLLPLTAVFLILAVGSLGYGARNRRAYRPFVLGILAAALVVAGKFVFSSNLALYGGIVLLISASLWKTWSHTVADGVACPACEGDAKLQKEVHIIEREG